MTVEWPDWAGVVKDTTSQRVERKYPICVVELNDAIEEISSIVPIRRYSDGCDWSSIRTTYLDTVDFQCYQEYLQNLPIRRKIRIRQYGLSSRFDGACWFELKLKNESLSLKRRFRCRKEDVPRLMSGENILDGLEGDSEVEVRQAYQMIRSAVLEQRLVPVVRVDYERISFQDPADPMLRVTLDRQLRFCSASREVEGRLEGLVLEVKHNGPRPAWLESVREKLGLKRITRYSKFGRCMKRLAKLRERQGPA